MPDTPATRPRLSIRQVEAFRATAQTGSVSRAAERMFVSQPAVSRLITDMEESIGYPLFDRGRRFQLTAEGSLLYREVQQVFAGLDHIAHCAEEIAAFRMGYLRIASSPALALGLLPPVIRDFQSRHDQVGITSHAYRSQEVINGVSVGHFDIGFAALPINQAGLVQHRFASLPALCMVPRAHRLSAEPFLTPALLAADPIISMGSDVELQIRINEVFEQHGVAPSSLVETNMSVQAALLAHEGLGIAIIDPFTAMAFQHPGLVLKPLHPFAAYEYAMFTSAHNEPSRLARAFIETTLHRVRQVERMASAIYRNIPGSSQTSS